MKEVNIGEIFGEQRAVGFDEVAITVAAPTAYVAGARVKLRTPETINYRTFKPEKGGLFANASSGRHVTGNAPAAKHSASSTKVWFVIVAASR